MSAQQESGLYPLGPVVTGGISAICMIAATVMMSRYTSSADSYEHIQNKMIWVSITAIFGALFLGASVLLYYLQKPQYAIYFQIIVTCLALGLSFSALCVAAISRS